MNKMYISVDCQVKPLFHLVLERIQLVLSSLKDNSILVCIWCMCVCRGQRWSMGLSTLFFETGSLICLEFSKWARLREQSTQGSSYFLLISAGITVNFHYRRIFYIDSRWNSGPHACTAISPVPVPCFKFPQIPIPASYNWLLFS